MAESIGDNSQCHLWNEIDKVTPVLDWCLSLLILQIAMKELQRYLQTNLNLYTKVYLLIPQMGIIKDEIKNLIINKTRLMNAM